MQGTTMLGNRLLCTNMLGASLQFTRKLNTNELDTSWLDLN